MCHSTLWTKSLDAICNVKTTVLLIVCFKCFSDFFKPSNSFTNKQYKHKFYKNEQLQKTCLHGDLWSVLIIKGDILYGFPCSYFPCESILKPMQYAQNTLILFNSLHCKHWMKTRFRRRLFKAPLSQRTALLWLVGHVKPVLVTALTTLILGGWCRTRCVGR